MSNQADNRRLSNLFAGYTLCEERDAWHAHRKLK
jgi:hypothetical protein